MRISRSLIPMSLACTLCATAPADAHAQVASGTVIVDTVPNALPSSTDSETLTSSGVGSVEIKADAFKASGQRGFVRIKVTRKSTLLNGHVRVSGILECGSTQRPVVIDPIRPGITTPWQTEITCSTTESPVRFVANLSLWPS